MAQKAKMSRGQSLDAKPVAAEIIEREPLQDGGQRITVSFTTRRWQRLMLRLPDTISKQFELDAFGVEIIDLCNGKRTVRQIIKAFAERHKLNVPEAEHAVLTFLRTLITKGIVAITVQETK